MTSYDLSYFLIAAGFIIALNLMAFVSLRVNYLNTKKPYLFLACIAIIIEIMRQVPELFIGLDPDANSFYLLSFLFQFSASLIFLCALMRIKGEIEKQNKVLLGFLILIYLASTIFHIVIGLPQSISTWYLVSTPGILTSLIVVWKILQIGNKPSSSRTLMIMCGVSWLLIRCWEPAIESIDLINLVYYMGVLMFPMMMMALNLSEVEYTHQKVHSLLIDRTQAKEDLQFILDHSLDIILITDTVGLLLSWNKRAEEMFGYNNVQAIEKIHIDELFSDNYWHRSADNSSEFDALMANVDGETFKVKVRIKTVINNDQTHNIYVLRDKTAQQEISDKQSELDRRLEQIKV